MSANVLVERRGAVAEVVLHRPEQRNALSSATIDELARVFADLANSDVAAVLLHGGEFFCAGFDLKELATSPPPIGPWVRAHRAIAAIKAPVVGCVLGGAINAGAALALAADLLIVGEASYLQIKEAEMGMTPAVNAAWLAVRHAPGVGLKLALSCQPMFGPELLQRGLASEVVPDREALAHASSLVERLSAYPAAGASRAKGVLSAARGDRTRFFAALEAARAFDFDA